MYEAFWVIFIIGLGLFCLTVILVRVWALKRKNYWKTQKMPYIESKIFLGTFASTFVLKKCITDACSKIYKRKEDHVIGVNIFHKPALMIKNHELIKRILLEDKSFFVSGDGHSSVKVENSINYKYVAEKQEMDEFEYKLETVLSRTEKSLLKEIFDSSIIQVGQKLSEFCSETKSANVNDLVSYYIIDVIVKLIYNIDAHCLTNPNSPYRKHKNDVFKQSLVSSWLWKKWKAKKHNFVWRNKLIAALKCEDRSKLSSLIRALKEPCDESDQICLDLNTLENIVYIFVDELRQISSTLVFCMYELGKNEEVQDKLRTELKGHFENNDVVDFNYICETKNYLNNVIKETLRLHPSPSILKRDCDFPDEEEEGYSLSPFYEYKVPRKMTLLIPVHAILRDEKHFENPEDFNPDRYEKTHEMLPMFLNHKLEGTNTTTLVVCVLKVFLCNILRNYKVKFAKEQKESMKYQPTSVLLLPNDPVLIEFEQI